MDLIDRQQAIDALTDRSHKSAKKDGVDSSLWQGIMIARRIIKNLPSAQSERMCYGCRYERHGSVVCDSCSRFFLDRYEVDNNE